MMLSPVRTSGPSLPPVTLEEAKARCRVDSDDDDELIEALVLAAVVHMERSLGIALVTQTWRQDFSSFGCLRLPVRPVDAASVIVDYSDADNAQQTLADDVYGVFTDAQGTFLSLASGKAWPAAYSKPNAISVTFDAGTDPEVIPEDLKTALLLHVAHLYENREAVNVGNITTLLPLGYDDLVWTYRRFGL